jgi:hypothetical protein
MGGRWTTRQARPAPHPPSRWGGNLHRQRRRAPCNQEGMQLRATLLSSSSLLVVVLLAACSVPSEDSGNGGDGATPEPIATVTQAAQPGAAGANDLCAFPEGQVPSAACATYCGKCGVRSADAIITKGKGILTSLEMASGLRLMPDDLACLADIRSALVSIRETVSRDPDAIEAIGRGMRHLCDLRSVTSCGRLVTGDSVLPSKINGPLRAACEVGKVWASNVECIAAFNECAQNRDMEDGVDPMNCDGPNRRTLQSWGCAIGRARGVPRVIDPGNISSACDFAVCGRRASCSNTQEQSCRLYCQQRATADLEADGCAVRTNRGDTESLFPAKPSVSKPTDPPAAED